ncbi:MAG: Glycosyltransferases involved in cell wall biogenesis [Phormidesmis priestleyi Ana]|uniref:Glycosyltransferases involved in cell wall biogenesis n=1 Tax=Phormidesmis priestleyi Ana TaxID=1666911 RepID=A0A0P8BTZ8_9CYAN|nr:MAG: Glycosyltransferases involved in cell wall biogenesis [Phormidesmis priestleyi Ana]
MHSSLSGSPVPNSQVLDSQEAASVVAIPAPPSSYPLDDYVTDEGRIPHSLLPISSDRLPIAENTRSIALSIVVPIYNEVETLPHLIEQIEQGVRTYSGNYEIICVDDGSNDGSTQLLKQLALRHQHLRAIILRRNYGQTAAMAAGFEHAEGHTIVTLDGDLQNDPQDILPLVAKLDEGYDLVSGWRRNRQDAALTRLLPSKIANLIIGKVTGVTIRDYGCSLKAYRAELVADMKLYGELHRFLPALAFIEGARVTEIPVRHHARQFGQSKYGLGRTFRVIMDLMTIAFIKTFLTRPMHVFGSLGMFSLGAGSLLGLYLAFIKIVLGQGIGDRLLPLLAVLLFLTGVQLFCFGLLAEMLMRTYHESQNKPIYRVRERIGSR